jgi:DNA (cytosine-5)-methyltransferase 1
MADLAGSEITVDAFAGGGGASTGIEQAYQDLGLQAPIEIAVNHDAAALQMHAVNHPTTLHVREDVFKADMRKLVGRRCVRLLWLSPDCKHFSKAKGGKPVEKRIRGLAWVGVKWAQQLKPRVIVLENVEEFQDWGPLVCRGGEWFPDPERKGLTFNRFVGRLRALGYNVEWKQLRACDYGAPTVRRRLFLVCRRDGQPIVWPKPTHGKGTGQAYRTAAECIDWSIPCPSIFERKRPLAEATLRRIARGIQRYVIDAAEPFIVPVTHHGDDRVHPTSEPLRTVTSARRGEFALISPTLIQTGYGERPGQAPRALDLHKPIGTLVDGGKHAVVAAFLAQHNTMPGGAVHAGHDARKPVSTISGKGSQQQVVTSHLVKLKGTCKDGQAVTGPMATVQAGGWHLGEVRAFLIRYYSEGGQWSSLKAPMATVPTKDRIGLVYVHGEAYQIVDIGMRMLSARELARAQGFPDSYVIAPVVDKKGFRADGQRKRGPLSKTGQIRMIGNSVCPPVARAIVRAQFAAEAARITPRRKAA